MMAAAQAAENQEAVRHQSTRALVGQQQLQGTSDSVAPFRQPLWTCSSTPLLPHSNSIALHKSEEQQLRVMKEVLQSTDYFRSENSGSHDGNDHHAAFLKEMVGQQQQLCPDNEMANQLLQILIQQEQAKQKLQSVLRTRPDEHYLTIAQNGTILEATTTVTGSSPDSLLMSSAYDGVHDEDILGLLFIKRIFWDKGQPEVVVYLRRRTIDGEWIWLETVGVSLIYDPIVGIIIKESRVKDETTAIKINRITRITAIVVQAVENSFLGEKSIFMHVPQIGNLPSCNDILEQSTLGCIGGAAIVSNSLLNSNSTSTGPNSTNDSAYTEQASNQVEQESCDDIEKKSFNPMSVIESVRKGYRLDLGQIQLYPTEVKLITLILTGKLPADQVAPLLLHTMNSGRSISDALSIFSLDSERSPPKQPNQYLFESPSPMNPSFLENPSKPLLSVVNFSYTYIGNTGMEMLSEILYCDKSILTAIDISFCQIEEKGLLALARALQRRKRKGLRPLKGVILSGNFVSNRAAFELGSSLSPVVLDKSERVRKKRNRQTPSSSGYNSDTESDEDFDDGGDDSNRLLQKQSIKLIHSKASRVDEQENSSSDDTGCELQVLHVASASLSPVALKSLLDGLGERNRIREFNLSSNRFGTKGASVLVRFLEGCPRSGLPMQKLDRLDLSNNNLGDDGTTELTRAISKRSQVHLVDLKLSSNGIGAGGIETIMNKLLHHNLVSLSLDKNSIGDQGCQLVAASLQSMTALARLSISFNQIGSRGIISLMRTLVGCESITYLGLSGNILRISGAIALAFTLAQHPRLEELDLDNCCLGQAAQCHLVAGIISNRWVPMKIMNGFAVGPPMVAIGALEPYARSLSNDECFRLRKNEQMKTILKWIEYDRISQTKNTRSLDPQLVDAMGNDNASRKFLNPEVVNTINAIHGTPSQNAYYRLLGWLSRIPFDDDELTALQKYFYDADGGVADRGSDGYINLKLRGDLLAALSSEAAEEIREEYPSYLDYTNRGSIGIDLDKLYFASKWDTWEAFKGNIADPALPPFTIQDDHECVDDLTLDDKVEELDDIRWRKDCQSKEIRPHCAGGSIKKCGARSTAKVEFMQGNTYGDGDEVDDDFSNREKRSHNKAKPRISLFPQFEQQLEELKATATEMMIESEEDPLHQEVILTQYAEASLTILRQLRYHCMNSGFDGWRKAGLKRKVLVIDDSTVTRKLVSRAFERANFIVDTASNGAEGVEKLQASIYDIAFMDIDMPIMNGFEATKKLREWEDQMRPGTRQPICALTAAYVNDFERSELMKFKEAGLDVMESKPCNIPRLFKVVDDVSPMFSDLNINAIQRDRSDIGLADAIPNEANKI